MNQLPYSAYKRDETHPCYLAKASYTTICCSSTTMNVLKLVFFSMAKYRFISTPTPQGVHLEILIILSPKFLWNTRQKPQQNPYSYSRLSNPSTLSALSQLVRFEDAPGRFEELSFHLHRPFPELSDRVSNQKLAFHFPSHVGRITNVLDSCAKNKLRGGCCEAHAIVLAECLST